MQATLSCLCSFLFFKCDTIANDNHSQIVVFDNHYQQTRKIMKKTIILSYLFLVAFASSLFANEVNIFSARHYDSDIQLYQKFTAKTGIKVNVVSGKSGALEKRIIEEGADSKADLYITADAGRLGAFESNLQG